MDAQPSAPGGLLAMARYADTRWLTLGWSKVLLIFQHCLVYSAGHLGAVWGNAVTRGSTPLETPEWYDVFETIGPNLDVQELVREHPDNWMVWSDDVASWSLRDGRIAGHLRLQLVSGERRKVLWTNYTSTNPFSEIESALARSLPSGRRRLNTRSCAPSVQGFTRALCARAVAAACAAAGYPPSILRYSES